jgi:hypothetical protein
VFLIVAGAMMVSAGGATADSTTLGEGGSGEFGWQVKLSGGGADGAGGSRAERPCLVATTSWRRGAFDYFRSRSRACLDLRDRLSRFEAPLVVSGGQPSSGAPITRSAVGMVFAPRVRRVQVRLCNGRERSIDLEPLSRAQSRESGLARFRFAAFSVPGEWCAGRIVSRDRAGRLLWDSGA